MAPHPRSTTLGNRTNRKKLPIRVKLYSEQIGVRPAIRLGYRRNDGPGTWSWMCAGKIKAFATADDKDDHNPEAGILDYGAAREAALIRARGAGTGAGTLTVAQAIDRYEADLETRGGDKKNATRVRHNLTEALKGKAVAALTANELRTWRDGLKRKTPEDETPEGMTPSGVNRTCDALRAGLNLAASLDSTITNGEEWERGLARLPDAGESRNKLFILSNDQVRAVVAAAYNVKIGGIDAGAEFGPFIETLAVTGTRPRQATRLTVDDLQSDRLMMPPSRKGGKKRRTEKKPVPIPPSLVAKLRAAAGDRPGDAPLLLRTGRLESWHKDSHGLPFEAAAKAAGLAVTCYALRHSSIVRQLLANVPVRVVASHHDTSVIMIEKTYSRYISDHTDALTRRALLDLNPAGGDNVRPLLSSRRK
jgi:integrase